MAQEYEPTEAADLAFAIPGTAGRPHRTVFFDGRARPVRTLDFNGAESTAEYRPFEVILQDANDTDGSPAALPRGQFQTPRREEFDVFRNRTRVVEELGGAQSAAISYSVSSAGDLLKITDAAGDLCTYRYDRMGRRLAVVHREGGERRLYFDGRGKVVRALDAAGNDLRAELDSLGRLSRLRRRRRGPRTVHLRRCHAERRGAAGAGDLPRRQSALPLRSGRAHCGTRIPFDGVAQAHALRYEFDKLGRETATVHSDGTRFDYRLTKNGLVEGIPGILNDVRTTPADSRCASSTPTTW